jgi:CheY-like chemotaxis protein
MDRRAMPDNHSDRLVTANRARMPTPATILIVEDDADVREIIRAYLSDQDYSVIEADNGDAAMQILQLDEHVDLLLTDIVMPGSRDGFALSREARKLRPALKVLHITGYYDEVASRAHGSADEMLRKPLRQAELLAQVGKLLGRWAVDRNPILRRAYDYWLEKAAGRGIPDRQDLDPGEIKDILPYLSILEIVTAANGRNHRYRLVGTRVSDALGYNPTNHFIEEFVENGHGDFIKRLLADVDASGQPLYAASSFRSSTIGLSTQRILLPFTHGGTTVEQIVIVQTFDWRRRKGTVHELLQAHATRNDSIETPPSKLRNEDMAQPPR